MTPVELPPAVIDTSVMSILLRRNIPKYRYYRDALNDYKPMVSFQTREELFFGAYNANWGENRLRELTRRMDGFETIYPDRQLVEISARIRSDTRKAGRELTTADAWIAAAAVMLNCPLVSDDGDFTAVDGLTLIRYR